MTILLFALLAGIFAAVLYWRNERRERKETGHPDEQVIDEA